MKYYLVFSTNSEDGLEVMRDAMQNCGNGRFAYAPNRPGIDKGQSTLGAVTEQQRVTQIKSELLDIFNGQSVSFDNLVKEYIKQNPYSPYRRAHIRKAAKELESEGKVDVARITSKTSRGLGGDDEIKF
jgi:hypothetical protein